VNVALLTCHTNQVVKTVFFRERFRDAKEFSQRRSNEYLHSTALKNVFAGDNTLSQILASTFYYDIPEFIFPINQL